MLILFRKIHDVGGKDNFKRLSKELILLYSKLSPQKIKESGKASDKVFTYEKGGGISYKVDFTDDKIEVTKTITGFGSFNQNNSISSDEVDYQFKPLKPLV